MSLIHTNQGHTLITVHSYCPTHVYTPPPSHHPPLPLLWLCLSLSLSSHTNQSTSSGEGGGPQKPRNIQTMQAAMIIYQGTHLTLCSSPATYTVEWCSETWLTLCL